MMGASFGPSKVLYISVAEAAGKIRQADRILVIGCSGGGKSTLSQKIADLFGLTYISIDREVLWLSGLVPRDRNDQRRIVESLAEGERWIMDGSNSSTFDIRVPRSDVIIWLRLPRLLCMWGIIRRWMTYGGRTRPGMTVGCPERLDWDFLRFVWTFENKQVPRIVSGLEAYAVEKPVLMLKSRREMRDLLDLLTAGA